MFNCQYKRFLLLFCFLPCLILLGEPYNTEYYVLSFMFISILSFLYNFECCTIFFHEKPIYYEDLEDTNNIVHNNPHDKIKFQNIFIVIHQFTLTLAFVIILDFFYHRYHNLNLSLIELMGLLGGFISLYQKITSFIGNILIEILYRIKKCKEQYKTENKNLQMTQIN